MMIINHNEIRMGENYGSANKSIDSNTKKSVYWRWISAFSTGVAFAAASCKIYDDMNTYGTIIDWLYISVSLIMGCLGLFLTFNQKKYFQWCDKLGNKLDK